MKARILFEGKLLERFPEFQVGDFGETVQVNVVNEDESETNLTGKTVKLNAKKLNDFNEYLFQQTMNQVDLSTGKVDYTFVSGDLSESGTFALSLDITESGVSKYSVSLGYLEVKEDV